MSLFVVPIVAAFYLIWILFCAGLALMGLLIPKKSKQLDSDLVKSSDTICKILNRKGLLTDEEYNFETNDVAPTYDSMTFLGYRFILGPMMRVLESTTAFDGFMVFLVKQWMLVHRHKLFNKTRPSGVYIFITIFCVSAAQSVGKVLFLANQITQWKIVL